MRTNDTTVGYDIAIGVGTGQTATNMVTTLSTVTGYQGINWTKFTYEFTPSTAGDYSFGVHVVTPSFSPNGINFDDFKLVTLDVLSFRITSRRYLDPSR